MEDDKKLMFTQSNWFWDEIGKLESNLSGWWRAGYLKETYENMRHLWRLTRTHYKNKDINIELKNKFDEIHKLVYNPQAEQFTRRSDLIKAENHNKASILLEEVYFLMKDNIKESNLEGIYGIPKSVTISKAKAKNISNVFGIDSNE